MYPIFLLKQPLCQPEFHAYALCPPDDHIRRYIASSEIELWELEKNQLIIHVGIIYKQMSKINFKIIFFSTSNISVEFWNHLSHIIKIVSLFAQRDMNNGNFNSTFTVSRSFLHFNNNFSSLKWIFNFWLLIFHFKATEMDFPSKPSISFIIEKHVFTQ